MKGVVLQFRRGKHRYRPRHFLVAVESVSSREEATKLVGKKVIWKNKTGKKKKTIEGIITAAHGNKGVVRVVFSKGLPGQALNDEVEII